MVNVHAVEAAADRTVALQDETRFPADVIESNLQTDVELLQVLLPKGQSVSAEHGDFDK